MNKVGRNDLCPCGSGLKYKKCHEIFDNSLPQNKYLSAQEMYLNQWRKNSEDFDRSGDYAWMADIATQGNPTKILDVGCGTGAGIKALIGIVGHGAVIVGIDENPHCLAEAYCNIKSTCADVVKYNRIRSIIDPINERFNIEYDENEIDIAPKGVTLIGSNICKDNNIISALKGYGAFDLITIWLIGTHQFRNQADDLKDHKWVFDSKDYRFYVQNTVYDMADVLLASGGRLHIVDRVHAGLEDNLLKSHEDQASTTSLIVGDIVYRQYDPSRVKAGLQMITTATGGAMGGGGEPLLASITATKP
jgi:SAM-dependent methyltransferase